jgi:hypothetical protein
VSKIVPFTAASILAITIPRDRSGRRDGRSILAAPGLPVAQAGGSSASGSAGGLGGGHGKREQRLRDFHLRRFRKLYSSSAGSSLWCNH